MERYTTFSVEWYNASQRDQTATTDDMHSAYADYYANRALSQHPGTTRGWRSPVVSVADPPPRHQNVGASLFRLLEGPAPERGLSSACK